MSGYRGTALQAIDLANAKGDITGTEAILWQYNENTPYTPSPVLMDGYLYFLRANNGALTCLDAKTGKPFYEAVRLPGISSTYASPMASGGHVYLTDRSGTTVVIKDSDSLEIVATNSVGETVDATPAPAGNELFIRGQDHLFCIAE